MWVQVGHLYIFEEKFMACESHSVTKAMNTIVVGKTCQMLGGWAGDIEMVKREETVGFARVSLWLTLPQPDIRIYCLQPLLFPTIANRYYWLQWPRLTYCLLLTTCHSLSPPGHVDEMQEILGMQKNPNASAHHIHICKQAHKGQ